MKPDRVIVLSVLRWLVILGAFSTAGYLTWAFSTAGGAGTTPRDMIGILGAVGSIATAAGLFYTARSLRASERATRATVYQSISGSGDYVSEMFVNDQTQTLHGELFGPRAVFSENTLEDEQNRHPRRFYAALRWLDYFDLVLVLWDSIPQDLHRSWREYIKRHIKNSPYLQRLIVDSDWYSPALCDLCREAIEPASGGPGSAAHPESLIHQRIQGAEMDHRIEGLPMGRILLFLLAIATLWLLGGGTIYYLIPDWPARGQFGDMFGAVNALFSGGALIGVIIAVILQREELRLQRKELELTRQEMARSALAQEHSARSLLQQTNIQTSLFRAQLLRDQFESYWKTYAPVTDEQVADFYLYPDDYMDRSLFDEKYNNNDAAVRRFIYMSMLYEFLAFTIKGDTTADSGAPLGRDWVKLWTSELVSSLEFRDVHQQYRGYYPEYELVVDEELAKRNGSA